MKKVNKKKNFTKLDILGIIIILLSIIIFFATHYTKIKLFGIAIDELIFNITANSTNGNLDIVKNGIKEMAFPAFMLTILLLIPVFYSKINDIYLVIEGKKEKRIYFLKNNCLIYSLVIFSLTAVYVDLSFNIHSFFITKNTNSNFIRDNYVNPKDVDITFKEKRNLIYIYLESMEASYSDIQSGGLKETNLIPNLTLIANENISFSNTNKLGGALQIEDVGWTTAAILTSTSGLTQNVSSLNSNLSMPKVVTLGDILYNNGYNIEFLMGSDGSFGNRKEYLEAHHYNVQALQEARDSKRVPENYYVWWGYEDSKLFEFAKEDITKLANSEQPFYFSLITTDTHFIDGYTEYDCEKKYDDNYSNAISCSDKYVYTFVRWIQEQPFYDNTTIVISGDHLTMQGNYFNDDDFYNRTVYNAFINTYESPIAPYNRRYTTLDMFPTTLASIGAQIEGDRLGLGVNLFSTEKTLLERYSIEYINEEIKKNSLFYKKLVNNE